MSLSLWFSPGKGNGRRSAVHPGIKPNAALRSVSTVALASVLVKALTLCANHWRFRPFTRIVRHSQINGFFSEKNTKARHLTVATGRNTALLLNKKQAKQAREEGFPDLKPLRLHLVWDVCKPSASLDTPHKKCSPILPMVTELRDITTLASPS